MRTIVISKEKGIQAVVGRLPGESTTAIQSYLFDKKKWDSERAQAWVSEHKKGKSLSAFVDAYDELGDESADVFESLKAVWTTAYVNDLPDSSFLYVESGEKDDEGKTAPRSKRHFPYKDATGKVDLPHVRNAIGRIPQSNAPGLTPEKKASLQAKARNILEKAQKKSVDHLGAIKMLGGGRVGGYAVLWGDEANRDLTNEFFRPPGEQGYLDIFKAVGAVPWFYHHGGDPVAKADPAGITDIMVPDGKGVWYETQLRKSHAYLDEIQRLIEAGALFTSSGTPPAARRVAPNGEITYWPISEVSGTTTPAEWRMIQRPIEAIRAAYKAIGLDFPSDDNGGAGDARLATEGERLNVWLDLYEAS